MKRRRSLFSGLLFAVLAVLMIVPLAWGVGISLKSNAELLVDPNSFMHGPYTLANYHQVLAEPQIATWIGNSLLVSGATTIGVLVVASLAGFGFGRLDFPGKRICFVIALFGLAVPEQALIIGRHHLLGLIRLHNSYFALIYPNLAMPIGMLMMTQYFRAIPNEIEEAARLDGASRLIVFWKVLLPLTLPAQVTLGILTFLMCWNEYFWPLISATNKQMYTLTVGIASSQIVLSETEGLGFLMAQAVLAGLPILLIYVILQKQMIRSVAAMIVR